MNLLSILNPVYEAAEDLIETASESWTISKKVETLLRYLRDKDSACFTGLVFVKTRAEATVLPILLAHHSFTSQYSTSTFVGESINSNRKGLVGDLTDIRNQRTTLEDLRQ